MVTRKDVAVLAGVSVATVSNVFSGRKHVSPEIAEKVREAAKQINYSPNFIARCLSLGRTYTIGIIITDYVNPFHMEILRGIEYSAKRHGYTIVTFLHENCEADIDGKKNNSVLRVDAILNFTTNIVSESFIDTLVTENTIYVDFGGKGMSFVKDYTEAFESAMKRLYELGHRRVGFISLVDRVRFEQDQRGILYRKLVKKYSFSEDDSLVIYNEDINMKSEDAGYICGKDFIERNTGATAVFVMNDIGAFGFYRALYENGIKIPEDISVIGFDGVNILKYIVPSLSTISLDKFSFGVMMAEKIVDHIERGDKGMGAVYGRESIFMEKESIAKCK